MLIFDLVKEPLGLPIDWYYEWIILLVIGEIEYIVLDMVKSELYIVVELYQKSRRQC